MVQELHMLHTIILACNSYVKIMSIIHILLTFTITNVPSIQILSGVSYANHDRFSVFG